MIWVNVGRTVIVVMALLVAGLSVLQYFEDKRLRKRRGEEPCPGALLRMVGRVAVLLSIAYGAIEAAALSVEFASRHLLLATSLVWLAAGEIYVRRARRSSGGRRAGRQPV